MEYQVRDDMNPYFHLVNEAAVEAAAAVGDCAAAACAVVGGEGSMSSGGFGG